MSMDLADDLGEVLRGRVAVVGVGHPDLGDDAAGLRLAQRLAARGLPDVIAAGPCPERWLSRLAQGGYDRILVLDAVEAGEAPGTLFLLDPAEAESRFPQCSTHKLSLSTLARLVAAAGGPPLLLLGIQPASLAPGSGLSAPVQASLDLLADLWGDCQPADATHGARP